MKPTAHLLHGYIGSGKTTFARRLEREIPAVRLTHDEWMAKLYGQRPPEKLFHGYFAPIEGLLWSLAGSLLQCGCDVIMDSGFWTRASRDRARERVVAAGGIPKFYRLVCPEFVMRARTIARSECLPADALWIDAAAFEKLKAGFEAIQDDEEYQRVDGLRRDG